MRRKFEQNVAAIRLLREIEADTRVASPEQKSVLVKYTGWGGLPQVFATPDEAPKWKAAQQTLKELLLPDEFQAARATVLNAHYTSPTVIRAMYAAVGRLGFAHGRVLEPACGLGHFFGLMPDDARARSQLTGVEIDPLTARLARMLYPDAEIRARAFEDIALPTNSFDLAISNVPFGDYAPHDPKLNARKFHIHDYYFVAALERVRPGGLVAFITSRGTMDKQYPHLRDAVAKSANLVAAIRLPNTAFKKNANTEVTTDIVILRKRAPGEPESGPAWRESRPIAEGSPIFLNEYYHANPAMLLGRMERAEHGMYGREEVRLADDGRDLDEALTAAVAALPSGICQALTAEQSAKVRRAIPAPPGVKPNAYVLTEEGGGGVARREGDELILLTDVSVQTARRIRRMIHVRDAVRECLRTQVENRNDNEVAAARFRLNQDYDYFAGQFGPISDTINVRTFAGDPDLPLLLSLENYHEDTNTATKTAIFHERTIQPRVPVTQAAGAKEALLVTLSEKGRVDLEHIGRLLGKPAEEFLPELAGAIYLNPVSRQWETDDEYLSGNVREKLAVAERVAESEPSFRAHAEALRGVQPTDLKATEIDARLGAVWIPADDVATFARELLRLSRRNAHELKVRHVPALGLWSVDVGYATKARVANRSEWGTERVPAHELIEDALNLRTPTVYDSDDEGKPRINPGATEGAREKQQKIKDRFAEWIWQDDERRERLVAFYNREFNHHRLRTFTGDHLTLPGASPTITLRAHQKAAVWRIVQSWNVLLGHVVGSGIMPDAGICRIAVRFSAVMGCRGCGIIRTLFYARTGRPDAGRVNTPYLPRRYIEVLQGSPLRPHIEHYLSRSEALGYSPHTIRHHARMLVRFSHWFRGKGRELRHLDETACERWGRRHLSLSERKTGGRCLIQRILAQLRAAEVTPPASRAPRLPAQRLADEYREFLARERGLVAVTIYHYARHAERFLSEHFAAGRIRCSRLRARDVTHFVQRHARRHSRGYALQLVNCLRAFFRFLHYRGHTAGDLSGAVPSVAHWRMSHLPKHLSADAVKQVLAACDRSTATGRRNYAILLLLARLGLRAGEIRTLQLEDVDWTGARLTIRSNKGRGWARLPLPADVGRAMAIYLRERPICACRSVFVRMAAPHTPFANPAVISVIVRGAIENAGVNAPRKGAHVFRHSLATEMLRQGASLDEIGQVLRHKDADTTAIYAKVDLTALRRLAVALPGGAR